MYKSLVCLSLVIAVLTISSCYKAPEELRLLTENYPPLTFIQNEEVTGFGTDVVNAIQAELGTDFPIQLTSWEDAYATALSEENVVLFTMDKTPEREELFHFIGPLGSNVASFYCHRDRMLVPNDVEKAKTYKSIATTTNWFTEQHLRELGFKNIVSNKDPIQSVKLLANKQADLAVFTDVTLAELCREAEVEPDTFTPVLELLSTDYYIAISKITNVKIVEKWQKAFNTIKANGELARLHSKWFDY
ncbi:MAG: transporter substrate-binding domain-containing protein [Candidatus Cloacimonetes bacterium]|jgi:polar amino acid transport system substrate-binding protein|nr:transporter substrate-binding domain-containing protein [Candidatus Cloacimonadota bacterium]MDD2506754.1 transporter substrate-binding domain-containing protein [Candidatus Cloacimonadota bacterium]MDD4147177.1 transporter substrate-binding domain-containing protein [Candidatus Cloacimonadota bacterium]MDD4559378.1 transporter substrate-binding domain-containing protein [Candidatus Cloacimonadota bacterium]